MQVNFTLQSSGETTCEGIKAADFPSIDCRGSSSAAHPCVRCGGQITVALASPGQVWASYVYVQPGEWGRFAGLPVLQESVDWLQDMGVSTIRWAWLLAIYSDRNRQGGSFAIDLEFLNPWRESMRQADV